MKRIEVGLIITILVVLIIGFLTMPAMEYPGDAVAVRIETVNFIKTGHFGVPSVIASQFGDRGQYFYNNEKTGEWFPKYGIMNTLVYAPAFWIEHLLARDGATSGTLKLLTLNIHNLTLMIACCVLFYLTARHFTKSEFASSGFSLCVIFSTFCWNYFRAQTFETHQILFLGVSLYAMIHTMRVLAAGDNKNYTSASLGKWLLLCALMLDALMLCKSAYVLLMPVFGVTLWAALRNYGFGKVNTGVLRTILIAFFIPCIVGFLILLAVNQYKFGSLFNTGYTQWVREEHLFSGDLLKGLLGFLFDGQFGVFLCFPLLLISLFYWRQFLQRYPMESLLFLLSAAILLVINAYFINWRGAWCYGPRYLLPILPFVSLPLLMLLDGGGQRIWNISRIFSISPALILLLISFWMQTRINALPFFAYYQTESMLLPPAYVKLGEFLFQNSMPLICQELNNFKNTGRISEFDELQKQIGPEQSERLREVMKKSLLSNYYWFP
jgi:hypothetical protein